MITYLNSFAENWMAYFGTAILQNTLFLGVVFLVLYLLRERDARIRYAVAAFGLIKLLVPPFVPLTINLNANAAPAVGAIEIGDVSVVATETAPSGPVLSVLSILFLVWIATALFMLASTLSSTIRLKWHLRASTFVKHAEIDGKAIDVYCSPNISVPMSIGLFPKRVYVPILWFSLTDELQHSLLRHEVAHIKRKDGLLGALQMLARAIYFFHPLVWILTRQADELREMACDDMAVDNSEVTPLIYSRCLVHVAEHMLPSWSCSSASTLMKQKNKLYSRVNYQVKETNMNKLTKNRSRLIWTLLLVMVMPLSWYCKQPDAAVGLKDAKTGKIYGTVTDAATGKPLAGVNIVIFDEKHGSATNMDGEYIISNLKPGKHTLRFSYIGYKDVIEMDIRVPVKKSVKVDVTLDQTVIQSQKVIVKPKTLGNNEMQVTAEILTNSPAPPPPPEAPVKFDTPPEPVNGFEAISRILKYPLSAKKAGLEGKVIVNIYIDENGNVTGHEIKKTMSVTSINASFVPNTKAIDDCGNAAVEALSSLKWNPAMKDGRPVGVWITVPVTFKLANKPGSAPKKAEDERSEVEFIPYDTPPMPIGGQTAISNNVRYPELAKKAGLQGQVVIQAKIGVDGSVEEATVLRGIPGSGFDDAAIEAIKKTKFTPAKQRDKDVSVWISIPVSFVLDDKE